MATKQIDLGPTGESVASNLRRIRNMRRMRLEDVADLMKFFGRPMSKATLSQIEKGQRRVDVDDLVVFARVLKVNPSALLFPPDLPSADSAVQLSGFGWQSSSKVRAWARGDAPLDPPEAPQSVADDDWLAWSVVDLNSASIEADEVPHRKRADG